MKKSIENAKKNYAVYKSEISNSLKEKNLVELNVFPWQKVKLTTQGSKLKEDLIKHLNEFEELLKINNNQKIIERIEDLGISFLLAPNLNKKHLCQLKKIVEQSSPIVPNLQFGLFLDMIWITEAEWFNSDFNIFEIMNND